jgi:hypothetical protein
MIFWGSGGHPEQHSGAAMRRSLVEDRRAERFSAAQLTVTEQ